MDQPPTVSVIIPTHGTAPFLRSAVESVLAQTFQDLELLVVENGPGHAGVSLLEDLIASDRRIRSIHVEPADPSGARNEGIRRSQGAYIAFLDHDDEWLPVKLERQLRVLEARPEAGMVSCPAWMINEAGSVMNEDPLLWDGEVLTFDALVKRGCLIRSLSSVVVRKACVDRVGLFRSCYRIANDYDLYLRLARRYAVVAIREPLYRYRLHAANLSSKVEQMREEMVGVLSSLRSEGDLKNVQGSIRDRIAKYRHSMAVDAMDEGRYAHALGYLVSALRHNVFIGAALPWGRFSNPIYRFFRPYLALLYCGWKVGVETVAATSSRRGDEAR